MAKPTIVLGAAGTGTSFAIATRLRANWGDAIRIVGTDIFDAKLVATSLICDEFHSVPYAKTDEYFEKLLWILEKERATTFIPILNDEIIQAAKFTQATNSPKIDIWNNPNFHFLIDKITAEDWLSDIGVASPYRPDEAELRASPDEWFVKPRDGFGSKNAFKLPGSKIVERDLFGVSIVQEVCSEPEITVDSFFDSEAQYGMAVCRERIETKSGVCTKARAFFDDELTEIARGIASALGQNGTICFQVMRSNDRWVVTDLNLRSGAGTALSCAAGYDVLSAAYACRIGQDYRRYLATPSESDIYIVRQYAEFVTARS